MKHSILRRDSFREQVASTLRTWIVTGEIRANEIYSVGPLALRLGVSATPVREAVLDLANEGLLEMIRNRGFRVPALTDSDLDELFELRLLLEVPSVVSLIGSIRPRDLALARDWAHRTAAAAQVEDASRFIERDRRFHASLLDAQPNRRLADLVGRLRDQTRLYGLPGLADSGSLMDSAKEHIEIVDSLKAGDADRLHQWMVRHIGHTRGIWAGRKEDSDVAAPASAPRSEPPRGRTALSK